MLKICKRALDCPIGDVCPHSEAHLECTTYWNDCTAPCDVRGGIPGSTCIDVKDNQTE